MFYALVTSILLNFVVLILQIATLLTPNIIILILFFGYLIAIMGILVNYRFMRIKEVQTVFYSAYKNRHLFLQDTSASTKQCSNQALVTPQTTGRHS